MASERQFSVEGGCTCGTVRFRLNVPVLFVHCCHCTWCQRQTGSAFAVNALIEATNVSLIAGEVATAALPSPSGRGQVLSRCAVCGVTLWSTYGAAGDRIRFVRVGTLDDPSAAAPDVHIYTSTKQRWVALPEDVPAVAAFYRAADYWPADSLARYKAATGS